MLNAYFPPGTVMAIWEPWLKMSGSGNTRNVFIRVDAPSDVIMLDPSDTILQEITWKYTITTAPLLVMKPEEFKAISNRYFGKSLFVPAALAWSRGLRADSAMHALWLNRAQAYIKL
jgi:hypothetical protein